MRVLKNKPLSPLYERDDERDPRWSDSTLVSTVPSDSFEHISPVSSKPEEPKKHNLRLRVKQFFKQNTINLKKPIKIVPPLSTFPYQYMASKAHTNMERTGKNLGDSQLRQDMTDTIGSNHPGLAIWHKQGADHGADTYENPFDAPSDDPLVRVELAKAEQKWKRISDEKEVAHRNELNELNDLLFRADQEITRLDETQRFLLSEINNQKRAAAVAGKRWGELEVKLFDKQKEGSTMRMSIAELKKEVGKLQAQLESKDQKLVKLSKDNNEANEQLIQVSNKNAKFLKENDDTVTRLQEENSNFQEALSRLSEKNFSLQETIAKLQNTEREKPTSVESIRQSDENLKRVEKVEKAPNRFQKAVEEFEGSFPAGYRRSRWKLKV